MQQQLREYQDLILGWAKDKNITREEFEDKLRELVV